MRVAILEDQLLTREGLLRMLTDAGVEVVAAVSDAGKLMRSVATDSPDAVILDVRLPPSYANEGLIVAGNVRRDHPAVGVLVLSQYTELPFVESLLESAAQSVGYLLKDRLLDPAVLIDALHRVIKGECVVDPAIVSELLSRRSRPFPNLTDREVDVLACIGEGLTNVGIARRLVISDRTVEVHVQRVFEKLGLPEDPTANRRVLAALRFMAEHEGA